MSPFRQPGIPAKLYGCFAIMWCTAAGMALWAVGLSASAAPAQSADLSEKLAVWAAILVFAVATFLLARWLRRAIDLPYRAAERLASKMATGDLSSEGSATCRNHASDAGALLAALQATSDTLGEMAGIVRASTDGAASSAGQLAAAGLHLATRTAMQTKLLEDASAALRQLDDSAGNNTRQARQIAGATAPSSPWAASSEADIAEGAETLRCSQASSERIGTLAEVLAAIASECSRLIERAAADQLGTPSTAAILMAEQAREMAQQAGAAASEIGALAGAVHARAGAACARLADASQALQHAAAGMDQAGQQSAALADGCAAHHSAVDKLAQNIAAIGLSVSATASVAADAASAAAGMRAQIDAMARASAAFILAPRHGRAPSALHLVSDRSGKVLRLRPASANGQLADQAPTGRRKGRLPHKVRPDLE